MDILIIYQHYWPETFRSTDIAETLVKMGNNVTVLCGLPNYSTGYIEREYKHKKNRLQYRNGVRIIRTFEFARRHNILSRLLNYYSFPFFCKKIIKKFNDKYDVVLAIETSPIMMCTPAIYLKKKFGTKIVMYEMDLWPESLLSGGIKKESFIYKHYKKISSDIYSEFDKILVSSYDHIDYIKKLPKCSELDIEYLPQYAESMFETRDYVAADNGVIDLVFAGNIGKAQSIKTIVEAAFILRNNPNFIFHIVGGGSELSATKKYVKKLNIRNVNIYGPKPLSEMPYFYKLADAMLVSLENKDYANMTIPGKIQSYMASGKPIIGSINGTSRAFINNNNIGFCVEAENATKLAELISKLEYKDLLALGKQVRNTYLKLFSKKVFFKTLLDKLN